MLVACALWYTLPLKMNGRGFVSFAIFCKRAHVCDFRLAPSVRLKPSEKSSVLKQKHITKEERKEKFNKTDLTPVRKADDYERSRVTFPVSVYPLILNSMVT